MALRCEQGKRLAQEFNRMAPELHFDSVYDSKEPAMCRVVVYTDRDNDDKADVIVPRLMNSDEAKAVVGRPLTDDDLFRMYVPC